ncbi:MAG: hypothetical protein P1U86_16380 [Verrucomicrobiales bacterium]|nr:hypothetical protein [Verrucomicrobiales bacterium]
MTATNLPVSSPGNGSDLYASFLEAYKSDEELSPVVFESGEFSLRYSPHSKTPASKVTAFRLSKLVDNSLSCPELRKVAEAARKSASERGHKTHGFADHIIGMSASLVGISILASLVVGVLAFCAIVIGVLVPFQVI